MNNNIKNNNRKIFLDGLPRMSKNNSKFDWKECLGLKVRFIYDDTEGWIEIIGYNKHEQQLRVKYRDNEFQIHIRFFCNANLSVILGKRTSDFKYEIGTRFTDDKRDITIVDRRKIKDKGGIERKYYKYHCNKCGFECGEHYKNQEYKDELWMEESNIKKGNGCSCCGNQSKIVVQDINDIPTTAPWMVKYFQGGYDEAKKYTKSCGKVIPVICPDCGRVKNTKMTIDKIYSQHSIGCSCSDSTPYPEKVLFSILEQLGIKFEYHKIFDWSKNVQVNNLKLCGRKEYDFYLTDLNIIIETHGIQHYDSGFDRINSNRKDMRTVNEEKENDEIKKQLALMEGVSQINYITINCKYSQLDYIKQNILDSNFAQLFDLSIIEWNQVEEYACSNRVKEACEYKRNSPKLTTGDISKIMKGNHTKTTIKNWLKIGNELGWCNYNAKEEMKMNGGKNAIKSCTKKVEIFKDNISLGIFESRSELARQSEEIFGIKLTIDGISRVCKGVCEKYKGYTFQYC